MRTITMLPVENLFPHPDNPRKNLGDLTELAESIRANGIMQNLTVVAKDDGVNYTVIIGHRRLGAAKEAGLPALPCAIVEMSPTDQVATMLLENVQRAELTPFEQMKGFQMLLDLGETVETISQKTGFSQSTVRRRIKLTELDEKKLADAMTRQVTLADLAKLEEIKSKKSRNECLAAAGTESFDSKVRSAITEQKREENKKAMLSELNQYAKETKSSCGYSYEGYYPFLDYKAGQFKSLANKECVYEIYPHGVYIHEKVKKVVRNEKSKAQLEKEKNIRTCERLLKEASAKARELRSLFYSEYVPPAGKNTEIYEKCTEMLIYGTQFPLHCHAGSFLPRCGKEDDCGEGRNEAFSELISDGHLRALVKYVCCAYDEENGPSFWQSKYEDFPIHRPSKRLIMLYDFLEFLGYKMSEEEIALRDGTHEAFKKSKSEKGA